MTPEILSKNMSQYFKEFIEEIMKLRYFEEPNYKYLSDLL